MRRVIQAFRMRLQRTLTLCALMALALGAPVRAQAPAASSDPGLKEVRVDAAAFARGVPVPAWSLPMVEIPATTRRSPVVMRLAETQFTAAPEKAYLVNRAIQVNDASSLAQIGQYTIQFVPQYQRVAVHRLEILRGGEVLERTEQAQVRFLERETGLESGVYSGAVTAVMLIPDVRVGDTLHIVYSVTGDNPVFAARFADSASWDQTEPTEHRRVVLLAPASRKIAWRMHGDYRAARVRPDETRRGDLRVLTFEERGLEGLDPEAQIPADYIPARFIQFTEYESWSDVARWATGLFPKDSPLPAELDPVIARLRQLPDPGRRAAEALRWVQEEVRYFSVSLGESSHRPHPPGTVVQRRYGDCKDKTLLLIAMLRELGIDATPMLVSLRNPRLPARLLPSPDVFDHVFARVEIGGRTFHLDPTRLGQRGELATMGPVLEGASALPVLAQSNELVLLTTPNARELATNELREEFTLGSLDGDAQLAVRRVWRGGAAEVLRVVFGRMTPEQLRTQSTVDYERRYPGISAEGDPRISDDEARNTLVLEARYKVPKPAREAGGDWVLRFFPSNLQGAISLPQKINRNFPAVVSYVPYAARYTLVVNWPDSVGMFADPSTQRVDGAAFRTQVQRSFRGNVATIELEYTALADTLPAKQLPQLVQDLQKLDRVVGGAVVVERSAIKSGGFFGLGKPSVQQSMRARLEEQLRKLQGTIAEGRLKGDDLAEALCHRGETLADLGRPADGMADAQEAVRVAPALPRAWQCRGNLLFANGEFARAVPDYTKALGLGGDPFEAYHRRGHARFYAGQFPAAASDFAQAAESRRGGDDSDGLYARLWQAWSLMRTGAPLPAELQAQARADANGAWPRPALAMAAGMLGPQELISQVERRRGDDRELTLSEAWFYVGQWHRARGETQEARKAFEACRAQGITMYIEHVAAGLELAALK